MVVHGDFAMYWMPDDAAPETNEDIVSDKIEFSGDAEVPDERSGIKSVNIDIRRRKPQQDNAFEENVVRQDGGFEGNTYTVHAVFDENTGTAEGIERLRSWLGQSNAVRGKFQHGRIGIRNNYRPEFNLLPNNDAGFKLQDVRITQEIGLARADVTIVLEFSGTPTRFGVMP